MESTTKINIKHKMNISSEKQCLFETIVSNFILFLTFVAFGFITIMSFIQTCSFDPEKYESEKIIFQLDFIIVNIIFLLFFLIVAIILSRFYHFFSKINSKFIYTGTFIYVLILGLIWIFSVWQVPGADSANIFEAATRAANNDYTSFKSGYDFYFSEYYKGICYFDFYPFQLGLVLISEFIYRIFGTDTSMPFQVINVISTAFAYCGIIRITRILFKRKSIEIISAVFLLGCLQPILLCSFPYGNLMGMCFSIWASFFIIKYLQSNKSLYIIPTAVLISIAVLTKYNSLIYVVAFAVVLIVHTVREKKIKSIAYALLLCFVAVFANNLVIMSYEKRANVEFEDGMSQILYLDMGLNESYMASGWYSGKTMKFYRDSNCNLEVAEELAKSDISLRLKRFAQFPGYAFKFFTQKILSQWNEPTYESIWVSKTKYHTYPPNALANSVYDGNTGIVLEFYFNQYMQILFLTFSAGLLFLIIRRKINIENILLILVLLGGFGYHLLFEAKSQYSLTYIILFIPTASFAVQNIINEFNDKIKKHKSKNDYEINLAEDE